MFVVEFFAAAGGVDDVYGFPGVVFCQEEGFFYKKDRGYSFDAILVVVLVAEGLLSGAFFEIEFSVQVAMGSVGGSCGCGYGSGEEGACV